MCPGYGQGFRDKSNLTLHQKTHSGENLHVCVECGCSLGLSQLSLHTRGHAWEKSLRSAGKVGEDLGISLLSLLIRGHIQERRLLCAKNVIKAFENTLWGKGLFSLSVDKALARKRI